VAETPQRFDPLLLSEVRLGVVAALLARPSATFSDLKDLLGLTQGNLSIHLQKLEEAGYVLVKKDFVGRRPRTTCRLSAKGRRALHDHVENLRRLADGAQPD
jgi:DNA-binding MarR family transcriptional regulator